MFTLISLGLLSLRAPNRNAYVLCVVDSCTRCPTDSVDFESELNQIDLTRLTISQKSELCDLLRKYSDVFSNKPGHCNTAQHEGNLVDNFKPKSHAPYRIPLKLQIEVNKQVDQLLQDQKVRPSNSPYPHPIVCRR